MTHHTMSERSYHELHLALWVICLTYTVTYISSFLFMTIHFKLGVDIIPLIKILVTGDMLYTITYINIVTLKAFFLDRPLTIKSIWIAYL